MPTKQPLETGAPANAKLLESHAADAEREVVRAKEQLSALRELYQPNGDAETQKSISAQIDKLSRDLENAYDLWFKLSKQVREYDKAVSEQRRDGEKIARVDVERMLTNAWRFQRIGRESFIIAMAQDAIRCKDEQDFYAKYADSIRTCESDSLKNALENEKFAPFVLDCYNNSL